VAAITYRHIPLSAANAANAANAEYTLAVGISLTDSAPAAMDFGPSAGHKEGEHASVQY
jgi:hypothetical protein